MAKLIRIDRNGTKYYEGMVKCNRCGGQGGADQWKFTGWTCYKCNGSGQVYAKWIERTPEYQAKLDERRIAKLHAKIEKEEAERKAREDEIKAKEEAERIAKEAELERIRAEKAISQHIGQEGDKIDMEVTYDHTAWYDFRMGWTEQTMYIHTFKDKAGNVLVWKTSSNSLYDLEEGDMVELKGTIKEHSEYKDQKQTNMTRCKVIKK